MDNLDILKAMPNELRIALFSLFIHTIKTTHPDVHITDKVINSAADCCNIDIKIAKHIVSNNREKFIIEPLHFPPKLIKDLSALLLLYCPIEVEDKE